MEGIYVTTIHDKSGHICGGNPETAKIGKLMKDWVTVRFTKADDMDAYLPKKRSLMRTFKSTFPSETIYTLVNIFSTICDSELNTHIDELTPKKGYFTSFQHFLREFEETAYPDSCHALYQTLHTF